MDEKYNDNTTTPNNNFREPTGIAPGGSLIRPTVPVGTAFNRKTVMSIALTIGALLTIGIMFAFTPQAPKSSQEALGEGLKKEGSSGPLYNPTPDELNNLPSSYQDNRNEPPVTPPGEELYPEGLITKVPMSNDSLINENKPPLNQQLTPEQKELAEAKKSPIRFGSSANGSVKNESNTDESSEVALMAAAMANNNEQAPAALLPEKNDQDRKKEFIQGDHRSAFYSKSTLQAPVSKYEMKSGTVVPAVLITGINSDLPGYLVAQVRENVFDTVTGRYLLIPQGTRLIGVYDSQVVYGQSRVMIVWNRMIYPNGYSIDLEGLSGVDGSGYSGLKDKVNNHYGKLFAGAFLTSILSAGVKKATESKGAESGYDEALGEAMAENVSNVGTKLAEKNLNIQPTIDIRPGFRFNVFVHKDFILQPYH